MNEFSEQGTERANDVSLSREKFEYYHHDSQILLLPYPLTDIYCDISSG